MKGIIPQFIEEACIEKLMRRDDVRCLLFRLTAKRAAWVKLL